MALNRKDVNPFSRDQPYGHVTGGLSKEVVSDKREINMGYYIYICDR
jgi:hypothetical protein